MDSIVDLLCTQNIDTGKWEVWFTQPGLGRYVIETFDYEYEAREFWQQQLSSADQG